MEQMLSTNQAEELSAIRQSCKARQRYAQIQMIALVAMAAGVIAFVLLLMPRASAALAQVDAVVGELASVDFAGMAERVDALGAQSSASMEGLDTGLADLHRALAVLEGVDLQSLNESIASLSAILEPLARLFGR